MKEYIVLVKLSLDKDEVPPDKWDWDRLLDLKNDEEVEVLYYSSMADLVSSWEGLRID
jgi:hypothetical protein